MMNMLYEAHNSSFSYADHAAGISEKDQSWEAFSDTLKRHFETECLKHPSRNA